jgi:hypothetical protein
MSSARPKPVGTPGVVIAGLVPAIPINIARCFQHRDGRDKPGHDDFA